MTLVDKEKLALLITKRRDDIIVIDLPYLTSFEAADRPIGGPVAPMQRDHGAQLPV
jgi:hypothetical protein